MEIPLLSTAGGNPLLLSCNLELHTPEHGIPIPKMTWKHTDSEVQVFARQIHSQPVPVTETLLKYFRGCTISDNLKIGGFIGLPIIGIGYLQAGNKEAYVKLSGVRAFLRKIFGENIPGMVLLKLTLQDITNDCLELIPEPSIHYFTSFDGGDTEYANKLQVTFRRPRDVSLAQAHQEWTAPSYLQVGEKWTTQITLSIIFDRIHASISLTGPRKINKKLLDTGLLSDAIIVAQNGSEIKCHRNILSAHSPVFETMFQTDMKESKTGILKLTEMTEETARAFLEYLYSWETKVPEKNSTVCLELLKASHMYTIDALEKAMEEICLKKKADWYSVDIAFRLFIHARKVHLEQLVIKSMTVLKSKYKELEKLPAYQELFNDDQDALKDLCRFFAGSK